MFGFVDRIKGDKVVWMILLLLILFSIVSIFSSTSLLANMSPGTSRLDIFAEQLVIVIVGMVIIFCCYKIPSVGFFRLFSQLGFAVSMILLLCLIFNIGAVEVNGARRAIDLGIFQLHVYEVVKVAMVMYLAWAVQAYKTDSFAIANWLSKKYRMFSFLARPIWKRTVYIFLPIVLVCCGILAGSVSSTLFIGCVMFLTVLAGGGIKYRELFAPLTALVAIGGICVGVYFISGGKVFDRVGTAVGRLFIDKNKEILESAKPGSVEFQTALDAIRQPESAKIAIHEGGLLGKGPGNSTQKYTVSLMFSDYMYSFIVEEYGLWGGILIMILYTSLLGRGALIVRNCENDFSKTAVSGLIMLIVLQAMMHIYINLDMGLLTGQTLPLISHGNTSFICFCLAFGIILSISKLANDKIEEEQEKADPLVSAAEDNDPVQSGLKELEQLEDMERSASGTDRT